MPPGHASAAFSYVRWVSEDLNHISLDERVLGTARIVSWTTAAGVGWARVEAGHHYPADVLAGAALGNFVTLFAYEAFLGIDDPGAGPRLCIGADSESVRVGLHWSS